MVNTWDAVLRVALTAVGAYAFVVVLLRSSGKRTLAQLNAFDLVVTVALGSTLATVILSSDVAFVDGAVALVLLVAGQFLLAWLSVRSRHVRRFVRSSPSALVWDGAVDVEALRRNRISESEVRQAVRASGIGGLDAVAAVVLETDGTLSVIASSERGDGAALADVAARLAGGAAASRGGGI